MEAIKKKLEKGKNNFVFVGEAGSGKSEIAINFAKHLLKLGNKPVHFFDMDMTKPLFRSRDIKKEIEKAGIVFHHEEQFMDAPTMVGGVNHLMKDESKYVVMDVGGDYIGARAIGRYAPIVNNENTAVYYVMNIFRPWSYDIEHIDETLGKILGVSHIQLGKLDLINNPNNGRTTTAEEFLEGNKKAEEIVIPYINVDFSCVREELYEEVKKKINAEVMPLHLFLENPWIPSNTR